MIVKEKVARPEGLEPPTLCLEVAWSRFEMSMGILHLVPATA
jgi:hypothetical protein